MPPPAATARGTPAGIKLEDGFSTKITFANNPTLCIWERTVQPPGLDGGDPVDQTTMFNVTYRTMSSRRLKTMTPGNITAGYDPRVYADVLAQINVKQTITITFPDGSTVAFYGFLQNFEPQPNEEGKMPEANLRFVPTNADPTTGAETAAVEVDVPGT